jgi:hypothetical protein
MFVSCVCCVLCIGLCVEPIAGSEQSYWMLCVCLFACNLETSTRRRPKPDWGCCATEQKILKLTFTLYTHFALWLWRTSEILWSHKVGCVPGVGFAVTRLARYFSRCCNRINGDHINTTRSCKHVCCRSAPDTVDWADVCVIWRFRYFGRWGSVVGWMIPDVSKERRDFISKAVREECDWYRDNNNVVFFFPTKRPKKNLTPSSGYPRWRQQVSPRCCNCCTKREDATSQCRSLVPF